MDLSNMRINYSSDINFEELKQKYEDPISLFQIFFEQARECKQIIEANTMFVSTCGDKFPSIRPVLLKEIKNKHFIFFTNYESKKSSDLLLNNNIAACFYWEPLERCVRIEGQAFKIDENESDNYFKQRPRQSQIGAWSSKQSSQIQSRDQLLQNFEKYEKQFEGQEIPRPNFWGGWQIVPNKIEFWQGEKSRLHQRLEYNKIENQWISQLLSP